MTFMTIRKVCKTYGISETLLRRLVREGICPGFRSGTRFLVDVDRLADVLHDLAERGETV